MASPGTKTISVTMWIGQAELLERASKVPRPGHPKGVSVSQIIREASIPAAAKILGEQEPEFDEFEPPHFRRGAISLAAESLGLTPEQFKQRMAETAAEAIIAKAQSSAPAVTMPIRRRRKAS